MKKSIIICFFIFKISFFYSQTYTTIFRDSTTEVSLYIFEYKRMLNRGVEYGIDMTNTIDDILTCTFYKNKELKKDDILLVDTTITISNNDLLSHTFNLINEIKKHPNLIKYHRTSFGVKGIKPIGLKGFFVKYSNPNEIASFTYLNTKDFLIYKRIDKKGMRKIKQLSRKTIRELNYIINHFSLEESK